MFTTKPIWKSTKGAVDLSSIMVGIVVLGILGSVIGATVFAVVPWTQDNTAKSELRSLAIAQNVYSGTGLSATGHNGSITNLAFIDPFKSLTTPTQTVAAASTGYATLKGLQDEDLFDAPESMKLQLGDGESCYIAATESRSGKVFWIDSTANSVKEYKEGAKSGCSGTDIEDVLPGPIAAPGPVAPPIEEPDEPVYVPAPEPSAPPTTTPPTTAPAPALGRMVLQWGTSATCKNTMLPLKGTIDAKISWGDGTSTTTKTALPTHTYSTVAARTITIEGSFTVWDGTTAWNKECLTNVTEWDNTQTLQTFFAFAEANNLVDVKEVPSTVYQYANMFQNNTNFNSPTVSSWDMSNATNVSAMFWGTTKFNQPLNSWNVSNVNYMGSMFGETTAFNQPLNNWNTANNTNTSLMFYKSKAFNQNINTWNVAKVTNMTGMFQKSEAFNQPLNNWNTVSNTSLKQTFAQAAKFNQNINTWNTAKVTTFSETFVQTPVFNQPLNNWNTSSGTTMLNMFYQAKAFNQPLSNWKTGNVTVMSSMFQEASLFNQPLSTWDTSKVTTMNQMFNSATKFNQNIKGWNVANVKVYAYFSDGSALIAAYKPVFK